MAIIRSVYAKVRLHAVITLNEKGEQEVKIVPTKLTWVQCEFKNKAEYNKFLKENPQPQDNDIVVQRSSKFKIARGNK